MTIRRSGFSLVETVVAMVILIVGLLGVLSTSALVSRMIGQSSRAQTTSEVAWRRAELVRAASGCPHAGGVDTANHVTVAWSVIRRHRDEVLRMVVAPSTGVRASAREDTFSVILLCD